MRQTKVVYVQSPHASPAAVPDGPAEPEPAATSATGRPASRRSTVEESGRCAAGAFASAPPRVCLEMQ